MDRQLPLKLLAKALSPKVLSRPAVILKEDWLNTFPGNAGQMLKATQINDSSLWLQFVLPFLKEMRQAPR